MGTPHGTEREADREIPSSRLGREEAAHGEGCGMPIKDGDGEGDRLLDPI